MTLKTDPLSEEKKQMAVRNFRGFLQQELIERCQRNSKYSLRSFARFLDIGPSALSDMINGKRSITAKMKLRLGEKLGLSEESWSAPSGQIPFQSLALDHFALIADWYHYAILELIKCRGFRGEAGWISRALGISKHEAAAAIDRLQRLELIEINSKGVWKDISSGFTTNIHGHLTSAASRKLQRQVLEMSIEALEEMPIEVRNHTSMTMAINPDLLPEAIRRIGIFRRHLCEFLETHHKPTQVYQMNISLYPLTQIKDPRHEK